MALMPAPAACAGARLPQGRLCSRAAAQRSAAAAASAAPPSRAAHASSRAAAGALCARRAACGGSLSARAPRRASARAAFASPRAAAAAAPPRAPGPLGPVVVIDNYDSFTYNLVQYLWDEGAQLVVFKNDEKTCDEIAALNPRGVLISPGPGAPEDSGIALQACRELGPRFPLFGVCMGHQCIGQSFGGRVVRAPTGLMHGKQSPVFHDTTDVGGLLEGMASPFMAARYHSLAIAREGFPEETLKVTAWVEDGTIMAVRHRQFPWIQGVQFHPESIITEDGKRIIRNWLASLPPA